MFEPTLVGSFSRMVNFLRISWSILSPSVVNFYAHLVNSRCRLQIGIASQLVRAQCPPDIYNPSIFLDGDLVCTEPPEYQLVMSL